jgi:ribosome-associated protein
LNNRELADLVIAALEDRKGQDITCLDVTELTPMTDYMIVVTGTSTTHVRSLADELSVKVKQAGMPVVGSEGREQCEWVLVDLGGVLVHVMQAATRGHYSLEDLWSFSPAAPGATVGRED